jgi:threonine dehydratase
VGGSGAGRWGRAVGLGRGWEHLGVDPTMAAAVTAVTREDIDRAAERLAGRIRRTPVLRLEAGALGSTLGSTTGWVLKVESMQHTGSFKPRGVFNLLLSRPTRPVSSRPRAATPQWPSPTPVNSFGYPRRSLFRAAPHRSRSIGLRRSARGSRSVATTTPTPTTLRSSTPHGPATCSFTPTTVPEILAGQGTVARELEQQAPEVDTVLVAVGGGGLIGGICSWYGASTRIVAVEPRQAPTLHAALQADRAIDVEVSGIAADSLGARRIGVHGLAAIRAAGALSVLVTDSDISAARQRLWDDTRLVAESGGATALAALTSGAYRPAPDECVAVLLCGANTDPTTSFPAPDEVARPNGRARSCPESHVPGVGVARRAVCGRPAAGQPVL